MTSSSNPWKTPHEDAPPDFLSKEFFAKLRNPEKDTGNAKDGFISKMRELQSDRACNQQFSVAQSAELLLLVDFFLELGSSRRRFTIARGCPECNLECNQI
jgi:hypothetical protein